MDHYRGLLAAIVLNAGGEIEVPTDILVAFPTNARIEMHEYPETNVTCIRVIDLDAEEQQ